MQNQFYMNSCLCNFNSTTILNGNKPLQHNLCSMQSRFYMPCRNNSTHVQLILRRNDISWYRSPYAYGNPHLHMEIQHPPLPRLQTGITICIFESPFAYRDSPYANYFWVRRSISNSVQVAYIHKLALRFTWEFTLQTGQKPPKRSLINRHPPAQTQPPPPLNY